MPAKTDIIVIGSSNTDMVIKAAKFPIPGETILGGEFFMFPGGKGANQAVAAARLGGKVALVAKIGNDIFGQQALQQFKNEGIEVKHVITDADHPSGVALITVDAKGENTIVVAQGSNGALMPEDLIQATPDIENAQIILVQLEIPIPTVVKATALAKRFGKKAILNPAPAASLPSEIFDGLYLITPNESEAEAIAGIRVTDLNEAKQAAEKIREKGVKNVIITLGSAGAYIQTEDGGKHIGTPKVKAVDSTAAGDIFNGALAVALSEGKNLEYAVTFANAAAALSVTRMGAQASAPFRNELTHML